MADNIVGASNAIHAGEDLEDVAAYYDAKGESLACKTLKCGRRKSANFNYGSLSIPFADLSGDIVKFGRDADTDDDGIGTLFSIWTLDDFPVGPGPEEAIIGQRIGCLLALPVWSIRRPVSGISVTRRYVRADCRS